MRGVRPAGGPTTAAAGSAPHIQETGMLFSRPLALMGMDPGGTIPDHASEKTPRVPPARRRRGSGKLRRRSTDLTCGHESASAPKPPLARAPS